MLKEAKIDEEAKTLTLVLDLQEPTPSASGKTFVVATSHGNVPTAVQPRSTSQAADPTNVVEREHWHWPRQLPRTFRACKRRQGHRGLELVDSFVPFYAFRSSAMMAVSGCARRMKKVDALSHPPAAYSMQRD